MAKLKSTATEETTTQESAAPIATPNEEAKPSTATEETTTIPEYVDKVLKKYPNYAKLIVDAQGGVYTEDSQHLSKEQAILYQNPYYKH